MKLRNIFIGSLLLSTAFAAVAQKRGVSENQFQYKAQMEALADGVFWFYNWGCTVGRYLEDVPGIEFVPMCWNGNYNADAIREYCASHPEIKYLLGFNEPNFTNQANMTPQAAAEAWGGVKALAEELGLKLVAPAMNYSPNPPYQDPLKWMDEFVALVGLDAFDYMAVHSYGGFGVMKDLAEKFHDRYGKDIWVTEFCYWPEEGNPNSTVSPASQIGVMMQSLEWLEKTDWIFRYAWFKAIGDSSASKGPNYGLLIPGRAEDPRELSEQGLVYLNMSTFDPEEFHSINTVVPAYKYITQSAALLGSCNDTECGFPIEFSRFNAGAYADYQFDVPASGDYTLGVRVSGIGEPSRFNPTIGIFSVNDEGEESELATPLQFDLSGSDDIYDSVNFSVKLNPGKQTIRIKDANPYQPSGIRISALTLSDGGAGIAAFHAGNLDYVDVYSLQGVCLRRHVSIAEAQKDLPEGIYIIGNKKTIIK